jgi:integrase
VARRTLTATYVERVKAPERGQVEHFDQGFPGLALRVSYGGGKSWVYFYRVSGRQRRMTLGTYPALSLADAREAWRKARLDVAQGRDPALIYRREKPVTAFAAVAEEWLKRDQAKNRTAREARRIIERYVLPSWGAHRVDEIGRRDAIELIEAIADRGTPVMARRVHSRLHRFFRWCISRDIIQANPMADLPKPGSETRRDRVLTDEELIAVWQASQKLSHPFGEAVRLLILTGARREEIGQLQWSEVEDATLQLNGASTKNGAPHDIPLSPPAKELIAGQPRIAKSDFIFTTTGRTPISGWSVAKRQLDKHAAIPAWRLHDLRRTVATGLQRLGVGLQVVESILGHLSGSRAGIVGIYQRHTYDAEKRAALEAWGNHVMAKVK